MFKSFSPTPSKKKLVIFIGNNIVWQCVEYCAPIVTVVAKPGYFSSPVDIPVAAMLHSTHTNQFQCCSTVSVILLQIIDSISLTEQLSHGQPLGRVAHRQKRKRLCYPCRMLKKNLLTILPVIYTGFLPSLSDKGPNVIFPISNPAKNRDDARLTL